MIDREGRIPGYYDSPWPAECGGPRRQKAPRSGGIGLRQGERLAQVTRHNGEWNVMMVLRAPGELYLLYNNHLDSAERYAGVERLDPLTLETMSASPRLPSGGHTWCGGIVVHENGYLYANNGNRCFKLDRDCQVVAQAVLPQDAAYNSLLVMHDGMLAMKNIERDASRASTFVVLEPERLEQAGPEIAIPEVSMGRIAMDTDAGGQRVYVPGSHHFYRYRYAGGTLALDEGWQPLYRTLPDDAQSFSWDSCITPGACWCQDNGDNEANVAIFSTPQVGAVRPRRGAAFHGLASSPQKLIRIDTADGARMEVLDMFGLPRGSIFSPPGFDPVRQVAIGFDTGNGWIGGWRHTAGGFEKLWAKPCRISMQMILFPDTGEVMVNDFQRGRDELVLLDVETGAEKGRVATQSITANGMFLSAGWHRDVMYCSIGSIARIFVE